MAKPKNAEKHTAGPWEFCGAGEIRSVSPVKRICAVEDGCEDERVTAKEYEANSCLIAAAPDLLEALKYVRSEWLVHPPCSEVLMNKVNDAIAKAEGRL